MPARAPARCPTRPPARCQVRPAKAAHRRASGFRRGDRQLSSHRSRGARAGPHVRRLPIVTGQPATEQGHADAPMPASHVRPRGGSPVGSVDEYAPRPPAGERDQRREPGPAHHPELLAGLRGVRRRGAGQLVELAPRAASRPGSAAGAYFGRKAAPRGVRCGHIREQHASDAWIGVIGAAAAATQLVGYWAWRRLSMRRPGHATGDPPRARRRDRARRGRVRALFAGGAGRRNARRQGRRDRGRSRVPRGAPGDLTTDGVRRRA
jgi:hypothetical protein